MNYLALKLPGSTEDITSPIKEQGFDSLGAIISKFLPLILGLAGLVLLLLLIAAGFQYLTSGDNPKGTQAAQAKMTSAFAGFILLFAAYWAFQIIGILLGVDLLKPGI